LKEGVGEVVAYKVIFLGLAVVGPEEEARLTGGLQKKFNLSPEKAEHLLQRVPIVVKKGVSKEEMEKYVKAFEEIGGRVKVEEESVIEPLEIGGAPKPEIKPFMGKMITCPKCGFEQPETDVCIKCGINIPQYLKFQERTRSWENQAREFSYEEKYSPWESGEGFIGAFLQTVKESLFSSSHFFKKVAQGDGYWSPLIYGIISGIIGMGGALFWQWIIFSQWFPIHRLPDVPYTFLLLLVSIALPFLVVFSILFESSIIQVCLVIVGGNKNGFQATFRAVAYSFSGQLFGIIPYIGSTLGGIYTLILIIFGVREGHGISTGRAVLAIFFPFIVMIGLGIIAIFFIMFFGSMGIFSGVRV
jgi:hypothetical protein